MKKTFCVWVMALLIFFSATTVVMADGFYAITNNIGYQISIWNNTDRNNPDYTGPWFTDGETMPRDMSFYFTNNVPGMSDYNIIATNWSENAVSNQNTGFFQLWEQDNISATINGGWSPDFLTFTMSGSGANASYASSFARFWQPDLVGVAGPVTFVNYWYNSITATFSTPAIPDSGGYTNSSDPISISGSFSGNFNASAENGGDNYGFAVVFNSALLVPLDTLDAYGNPTSIYNSFGTTGSTCNVPEPTSLSLLAFGLVGLAGIRRKFRQS
jgi:hypothetical protein